MIQILQDYPDANKDNSGTQSTALKIVFYLATFCVVLQLLAETYRLNFLGVLVILQIYFLLFIGYFNSNAVWYLLFQLGLSICFDISYLLLISFKINIMPYRSSNNDTTFYFNFYFLLLQTIMKVILICQLFSYRNIRQQEQYFKIGSYKFPLRKVLYKLKESRYSNNKETQQSRLRQSRLKQSKAMLSVRSSRVKQCQVQSVYEYS